MENTHIKELLVKNILINNILSSDLDSQKLFNNFRFINEKTKELPLNLFGLCSEDIILPQTVPLDTMDPKELR